MILTFNYGDLQDIKKKMLKSKKINSKTIYICIESFKETLNYMYENNLLNNISKEMLEKDIFATNVFFFWQICNFYVIYLRHDKY